MLNRAMIFLTLLVAGQAGRVSPKDTELPAVTYMMNASANTLGKISKHVATIGDHMSHLISEQKSELAKEKADFEKQLKLQADINAKLEGQNEKTSTEIWELEKNNDDLRAQAKKLQKQNANLRKAFTTVEAKMGAVDQFAKKVLEVTDDEQSPEVAVLNQKEGKDSDGDQDQDADAANQDLAKSGDSDQDKKDGDAAPVTDTDSEQVQDGDSSQDAQPAANATSTDDSDDNEGGTSFLSLSAKLRRTRRDDDLDDAGDNQVDESSDDTQVDESSQNATSDNAPSDTKSQNMVDELKNEIAQLSQQQESSRAELTKLFQGRFKTGADKKAQILGKQKLLESTKASLTKLHAELEVAVKHLQGTKKKLEDELHGLGHYLGKLASYVNKPAADAEKALPSLPSDVQTFLKVKL